MIIKIVLAVLGVILVSLIVNIIQDCRRRSRSIISFKESMDLTELPVITFMCNERKLNFLLDTGSNRSYINSTIINDLEHKKLERTEEVIGAEGNGMQSQLAMIQLTYKDQVFETGVNIMNLDDAFTAIKDESGVQIHGILGSLFFQKYKYVLDFDSLIAYIK